ncbi:hypothetical protein SARC_05305 [Sphaeroforma arctica JP610]|uniref:C2H2-type domain-containing protein n=1 Tax=Sphaeroforma arctica JP610 TaxID=667725 RepID=A0A0L0G0M6_9EUKA|nr:hypothetical protein SARC_05305 [Sphaeroforma arctica JP610]KNC82409.1 hypothetical protein SARC_05305 [Sphaeroforma arctica JP610]|eukprot:XP_014156311.1 hypothetical protein SARC_05305 [Sphaeroforma arctica JP610]
MSPIKDIAEGSSPVGDEESVASGNESDMKNDDGGGEGRRRRRTFAELDRSYVCEHPNCGRPYASEHSLNQHVRLKHASRSPARRRGLTLPMYMPLPNQNIPGMQGGPPVSVTETIAHSPALGRVRGMPYNNPRFPLARHGSLKDCRLNVATGERVQGGAMSAHAGDTLYEHGFGSASQPGSPGGGRIPSQRLNSNQLAWSAVGGFHDSMNKSNTTSPQVDRIERMRMNSAQSPMTSLSMGNLPMRMNPNNMATSLENFQQLRDSTDNMNSWHSNKDLQMQQNQQQRQFNQSQGGSAANSRNNSVLDLMGANFVAVTGQDQSQSQQMQMQHQQYQQQQMQQRQQFSQQYPSQSSLSASNSYGNVAHNQPFKNTRSFGNDMQSMSSDSLSQQSNNLRTMLNNPLINPPPHAQQQVNRIANQSLSHGRANSWNPQASDQSMPNFSASREDLMVNTAGMFEGNGEASMPGSRNTSTTNLMNPYRGNDNMVHNNGPNQFNQQGAAPGYSSPMSISASNLESVIHTLSNSSSLSDVSQFGRASPAHSKVLSSSNLSRSNVQHQRSAGNPAMFGSGQTGEGMSTLADKASVIGRTTDMAFQQEILDHLKNLV